MGLEKAYRVNLQKIAISPIEPVLANNRRTLLRNTLISTVAEPFCSYHVRMCMEPIRRHGKPPIATWMGACLASAFSAAAAMSFLAYIANAVAAGAIIGLPGREVDVLVDQQHAHMWLSLCAVFQFGAAIALFSILRFGAEADRFVRFASRGVAAAFLSFVTTLGVGGIIFEMVNLLRLHLL
jgi:hypothetical protein